jgi:hypothetical protein
MPSPWGREVAMLDRKVTALQHEDHSQGVSITENTNALLSLRSQARSSAAAAASGAAPGAEDGAPAVDNEPACPASISRASAAAPGKVESNSKLPASVPCAAVPAPPDPTHTGPAAQDHAASSAQVCPRLYLAVQIKQLLVAWIVHRTRADACSAAQSRLTHWWTCTAAYAPRLPVLAAGSRSWWCHVRSGCRTCSQASMVCW